MNFPSAACLKARTMKAKFPMPWKKALREIFGGRTEGDRTRLFRAVWRSQLQRMEKLTRRSHPDNTDETIAMFKEDGMTAEWLAGLKGDFAAWRVERDRTQRSNAARSRWEKVKAAKSAGQ